MFKKLIIACMALAAFAAFAVMPASAMAENSPELGETTAGGVWDKIAVGSKLKGTATNTQFTDTSGNVLVTCSNAEMTGEVTKNDGSNVEGTISTSDFWGTGSTHADNNLTECTGSFGNAYITVPGHLCVRSTTAMATDEVQVQSGTCGGALSNVTYIIGSTTAGVCKYETTSSVKGDGTTHPTAASVTVRQTQAGSGATGERTNGFLCPHSGMLKMTFSLETEDGTPVYIR